MRAGGKASENAQWDDSHRSLHKGLSLGLCGLALGILVWGGGPSVKPSTWTLNPKPLALNRKPPKDLIIARTAEMLPTSMAPL